MIKQLNKVENAIFIAGAILIVAGVLANILNLYFNYIGSYNCYIFFN